MVHVVFIRKRFDRFMADWRMNVLGLMKHLVLRMVHHMVGVVHLIADRTMVDWVIEALFGGWGEYSFSNCTKLEK